MKTILRSIFLNSLVLYLSILVFPGMVYDGTIRTLILAAITLTLLNKIVKPIIKLLLLPINLLTLGLFGWVVHVATLFILTQIISGFAIKAFYFPGINVQGFAAPAFAVSVLMAYVLASLTISLISSLVSWLLSR